MNNNYTRIQRILQNKSKITFALVLQSKISYKLDRYDKLMQNYGFYWSFIIIMKLPPLENSQTNLKLGLDIMGKISINARQWTGKFAQLQNQHQYPKDENEKRSNFSKVIVNNFLKMKIGNQVCGLCLCEKQKSEMELLCKCHHSYCYSCLNSYAITKIQQISPVKCPQQQCSQTMHLTSNVYRYLPDSIKLKFLQYKHTFKANKQEEANRCQRCLQQKHAGQCKFALTPELVEQSFKFRQCPKCRVQIRLTSGSRKVSCPRCNYTLCYLCGVAWNNKHQCSQKDQIRGLQKQKGYHGCCGCCDCCSYGCENHCVGCGDFCCRNCGDCCVSDCCCEVLFNCEKGPNLGCCMWNICSIPVRILLTLFIITCFAPIFSLILLLLSFWLVVCIICGFFYCGMQFLGNIKSAWFFLFVLLYPIAGIIGIGIAISETAQVPTGIMSDVCGTLCEAISGIWIGMSPKQCDCG